MGAAARSDIVHVRLTKDEAQALDTARASMSRSQFVRLAVNRLVTATKGT